MIPRMRGMKPEDVYALKGVSDPRLSPDGTTVAFVPWSIDGEANEYRGNIWLAPVDGSEPPRRFTTGERRDGEPRWSPDGSSLAFVSSRAEKEPGQLYVISLRGGEAQKLTKLKEDVRGVAWSPDGKTIAFTSRLRDEESEEEDERRRPPRRITHLLYKLDNEGWIADRRSQVFVVPADGSAEPKQLTDAEQDHGAPVWSPDGSQLVFSTARGDDWDTRLVSDLYVMPAEGGEPQLLTHGDGACGDPVWSPDGTRIAYRYTPDPWVWGRHTQIAVLDLATRGRTILTESLDLQCGPYPAQREPAWNDDQIVFGVEDGGSVHVYAVPADGSGEPELLVGGERRRERLRHQGRHDRARGEHAVDVRRPLRRREAGDGLDGGLSRAARGAGALHRALEGRHRGRGVARAARRLRGRQALPGSALDPRRAVHAVRLELLRRVPGVLGRGLRGRVREPARVVRLQRGLGNGDPGAGQRRGTGVGHRRLRGPDGSAWTRRSSASTSSTRSAQACSAGRTAAT